MLVRVNALAFWYYLRAKKAKTNKQNKRKHNNFMHYQPEREISSSWTVQECRKKYISYRGSDPNFNLTQIVQNSIYLAQHFHIWLFQLI